MNPKLALYFPPYPRVKSYYELIDMAADYHMETIEGFCHMELADPDIEAATRIREYADKKGIGFCCFSLYANIVGENAELYVERMKAYADVAAVLGSPYLHHTIAPFADPAKMDAEALEEVFQLGLKGVREIYDYAATLGIRAVYEDQGLVFNGLENFTRFINEVDRNVGVVADFGNIYQTDERVGPFIERFADRIVHVHLKDMKLISPDSKNGFPTLRGDRVEITEIGDGSVDFAGCIRLLKEIGYNAYYSLEYTAPTDDSPAFVNSLELANRYLEN